MKRRNISSVQLSIFFLLGKFILRFAHNTPRHTATVVFLALLVGCSGGSSNGEMPPAAPPPFQELYDQGIDRYLGKFSPMLNETEGDVVTHTFGSGDGPLCLNGGEYRMATRDKGSSELLIFLNGGGMCLSAYCFVEFPNGEKGMPALGVLDTTLPGNPLASSNVVYLPYCDGGFHISDADSDSNGDGQVDRYQRGLRNLSAALDVAVTSFPSPSRIVLAGQSAGGFGASFALPLVRKLYPDVPITLINDSGVGLLAQDNPSFTKSLFDEWNASAFFPASCSSCIGDDGYITDYHKWQLGQDANVRLGMLSFKQDSNFALFFASAEQFEETLVEELSELEGAYPDRMHSFLADGAAHTFLLNGIGIENALQVTAGSVAAIDWVSDMLSDSADWESTSDSFVGIDTDGDGTHDHLDADDDNDGIFDVDDQCPLDPNINCPVAITDTIFADGKEWLQVSLFTNLSWNDINAVCPVDNAGICSGTLKGYDMNGWTWANSDDIATLFNGYGVFPPLTTPNFVGSRSAPDSAWAPAFFGAGWGPTNNYFDTIPYFPRIFAFTFYTGEVEGYFPPGFVEFDDSPLGGEDSLGIGWGAEGIGPEAAIDFFGAFFYR